MIHDRIPIKDEGGYCPECGVNVDYERCSCFDEEPEEEDTTTRDKAREAVIASFLAFMVVVLVTLAIIFFVKGPTP
jgi:hypothetical protein